MAYGANPYGAYNTYREVGVKTASQGKLIVNSHVDELREKGKTVDEVFKEVFSYAW